MPRLRERTAPYVAVKTLHGKRAGAGEPMAFIRAHVGHEGAECVFWPYAKSWKGYGEVQFEGRASRAHRVMCRLANGEPPAAYYEASHTCNRGHEGCVNPRHLVWETHRENHQRRRRTPRIKSKRLLGEPLSYAKGAKHPNAKLTEEQVLAIRADNRPARLIALAFGVNRYTIRDIKSRRIWKHV